jgi:uroporphyrinogen-III decarboxylase
MKFHREEYLELMSFGGGGRPMFVELFGPLVGLDKEWRAQGATEEEIGMTAFDWDYVRADSVSGCNAHPLGPPPVIVEDNQAYQIQRDFLGRTLKLCKATATIPLPMDFPVKTMDDWLRLKPMYAFTSERIDWQGVERSRAAQREGTLIVAHIPGAFDTARELMGEEIACLSYYEDPELMQDVIATISDTSMKVWERVSDRLVIDQLSVHEDLAGKSGPIVGPVQIEEYFKPYFLPLWNMLSSRGTKIFQMDTDGDVNPVIEALLDCGINSLFPMEPAAEMDIVEVRKKYGKRLAMLGGIDKHVLRCGKEEIRRELEYKLQPMMREGGMVFGLDHRIPNGTPLENYRYYTMLGREILSLPPIQASRTGWGRMAF